MIGELMAIHPPAVVRVMTLREGRAILRAVHEERKRQTDLQCEIAKAQQETMIAALRAMAGGS